MSEFKDLTRKEFLKRSSVLIGAGLLTSATSTFSTLNKQPEYRIMGRSGFKVSAVGLGATRTMEPAIVKTALDHGVNFIDTGRSYFNGQNEVMIGEVLRGIRKNIIIQSKITLRRSSRDRNRNDSASKKRLRQHMQSSLEMSLRALQTDYIDIMLIRNVKTVNVLENEAVLDFFQKAKEKGHIRACGFASHENQAELVKHANKSLFYDNVLVAYNHKGAYTHSKTGRYGEWDQEALEAELIRAHENKIGIAAMKTCSAGLYAEEPDVQPTIVAGLKWILKHPFIHTMAVAMSNMEQINQDVQAMYA